MLRVHDIELPTKVCAHLDDHHFDTMINVSMSLEPLWENALGKDWRNIITYEKLKDLYQKM